MKFSRRRGFTLIEMLVVIAIIGILIALTAAAVMRFRGVGIGSATKTNLGKVHTKLREQWKGVTDGATADSLSAPNNAAYAASALNAGSSFADASVRARYVQLRQRQAFPTSFAEAFWPDPAWRPGSPSAQAPNAWQGYVKYLRELGIVPENETSATNTQAGVIASWGTKVPLDVQQSICLLMFLEKGPKNTGTTRDDLGTNATGRVGNLGPGVIDAFGQPVIFTRQYNGQDASLALLSAGADKSFGVNRTSPGADATTLLARDPTFTVVVAPLDVRDNILVTNP